MLSLTADRLDYGEQLRAPDGYKLDSALATTYSLDLDSLIAASLALSFDQTLEGEIAGERLAFLEALDQLQSRLLVFYQQAGLKVPTNYNRLFTLLEPMLAPCVAVAGPAGAFASFHPKLWLLRFAPVDSSQPTLVRLLVLSRNLSFDRSWDIALCLEGKTGRRRNPDSSLQTFLRSLSAAPSHSSHIEDLCTTLDVVDWTLPERFDAMELLPGSAASESVEASIPFQLTEDIDELLIVSPFVDADPESLLNLLGLRTNGIKTLISRADTLDSIGEAALEGWDVKSLSELVVDGEERLEREKPRQQGLHAKLIVTKTGNRAVWHVGSANMTNAAFGRPGKNVMPRNTELMVKLSGYNKQVGPAKLLEEWSDSRVFEKHVFREAAEQPPDRDQSLRLLVHRLTSARWELHATECGEDDFSVDLLVDPVPDCGAEFRVNVAMLCRQAAEHPLAPKMSWRKLKLTDVSAFIPVEVHWDNRGFTQRFAVQAKFAADLMDIRKRAVFRETIQSKEKLLRYLTLLLDVGATKSRWLRADGDAGEWDIFGLNGGGGLYEQLLRSASRAPERLKRAVHVFEQVKREGVELPEGLQDVIAGFELLVPVDK